MSKQAKSKSKPGAVFLEQEVAALYRYRPPYPKGLYAHLKTCTSEHQHLLDIGCGHGKIARYLSGNFEQVTAIDPSTAMINAGRAAEFGDAANLSWVTGFAETAAIPAPKVNLVTAALSLHWMDQDRLFPHLAPHLAPDAVFACIGGDNATDPPWQADWIAFLTRWIFEMTGEIITYKKPSGFWSGNDAYVEIFERKTFTSPTIEQSIDDFILCQHSRNTFALSRLGAKQPRFNAELRGLLSPYADKNGCLSFNVETSLTLARIKT